MKKKLFITGAAGKVGSGLRRHLKDRYDFRLLFHRNIPEVEPNDEIVVSRPRQLREHGRSLRRH